MLVEIEIEMGIFKKHVTCIMIYLISFTSVTLWKLYLITSPVLLRTSSYRMRKIKFFGIYSCFSVSHCIKGGRKLHKIALSTITFLNTNVCVNNPYWQSSRMMTFSYQCNISKIVILYSCLRHNGRLFNVFFLFFTVILSELHEKPRKKDWVIESST